MKEARGGGEGDGREEREGKGSVARMKEARGGGE